VYWHYYYYYYYCIPLQLLSTATHTIRVVTKVMVSSLHALDGSMRVAGHVKLRNYFHMASGGPAQYALVVLHCVVA